MEEEKNILYAYIKGATYNRYRVLFDGNENIHEIDLSFEDLESMQDFIINFSNYNSISVQYYI